MSAWGYRSFENDDALDWLAGFTETRDPAAYVRDTFAPINEADEEDNVEIPECAAAVAAAEAVVAAANDDAPRLPAQGRAHITPLRQSPLLDDLREEARSALRRILDDSELAEEWHDAQAIEDMSGGWENSMRALIDELE
ncbi:MAG: DUF4259 domain-containing protein [Neomegalonema sp.]|nr:DUF4259 domain-containing protein [Neomegalonema sp.]